MDIHNAVSDPEAFLLCPHEWDRLVFVPNIHYPLLPLVIEFYIYFPSCLPMRWGHMTKNWLISSEWKQCVPLWVLPLSEPSMCFPGLFPGLFPLTDGNKMVKGGKNALVTKLEAMLKMVAPCTAISRKREIIFVILRTLYFECLCHNQLAYTK